MLKSSAQSFVIYSVLALSLTLVACQPQNLSQTGAPAPTNNTLANLSTILKHTSTASPVSSTFNVSGINGTSPLTGTTPGAGINTHLKGESQ